MALASLYQEDMSKIYGIKYTCETTVTKITPGRSWFFVRCLPCKRKIDAGKDGYTCLRHGEAGLRYRYYVNYTLEDSYAKVHACIFDEGVTTMLGIRCYDMITKEGYSDPAKVPDPIYALRGMRMIFLLQNGEMSHESILRFTINKVFHPSTDTNCLISNSPAKTIIVLPAPHTPAVLAIKQLVSTPVGVGLIDPVLEANQSIGGAESELLSRSLD